MKKRRYRPGRHWLWNAQRYATRTTKVHSLPAHVAARTYPAFARFVAGLEHGGDALDLGARLADELAAALA